MPVDEREQRQAATREGAGTAGCCSLPNAVVLALCTALLVFAYLPLDAKRRSSCLNQHHTGPTTGSQVAFLAPDRATSLTSISRVGKQILALSGNTTCFTVGDCKDTSGTRGPLPWVEAQPGAKDCEIRGYGEGWGAHRLCSREPTSPCVFYSFGINDDYSFDTAYANATRCRGFGFDPTVVHPAMLHENVSFAAIGATVLDEAVNAGWHAVTSVPGFKKWQRHGTIAVLKMDCEGCEFALPRDVMREDPDFFRNLEQFAVEVHVTNMHMPTPDHVLYFGHLFTLLHEAGLLLRDAALTACGKRGRAAGCPAEVVEQGYPCGEKTQCQNLLFAR